MRSRINPLFIIIITWLLKQCQFQFPISSWNPGFEQYIYKIFCSSIQSTLFFFYHRWRICRDHRHYQTVIGWSPTSSSSTCRRLPWQRLNFSKPRRHQTIGYRSMVIRSPELTKKKLLTIATTTWRERNWFT